MRAGRHVAGLPTLDSLRARARDLLAALRDRLRGLGPAAPYEVRIGAELRALAEACDRSVT